MMSGIVFRPRLPLYLSLLVAGSSASSGGGGGFISARQVLSRNGPQQRGHACCFATSASSSVSSGGSGNDGGGKPVYTLESIAMDLAKSKYKSVVVVSGAGISVSAGIPDFRSPGTGLYDRLEEYKLPYPEAIFDLEFFRSNPAPFATLASSIWPGQEDGPKPTLAHSFLRLLENKGCLRRVYTQNIDGLESLAGVSDDKLVECHGHFRSCSCISPSCGATSFDITECRDSYLRGEAYRCRECGSLSKPDIVFFGEVLPERYEDLIEDDMYECDLLIVMGTSLLVNPVAAMPDWVGWGVPRVLINRELVGSFARDNASLSRGNRDVFEEGDCDHGVAKLCKLAGEDWEEELSSIHESVSE